MKREFREKKKSKTTTYHSLLSQSLLVRLPHFLALGANRIRVGRAMLHVFCLFFPQRSVSKQQKVTKRSEEEENRWLKLKKTGRFRVRFEKYARRRKNSSESSSLGKRRVVII